jgi:hypothetical protein
MRTAKSYWLLALVAGVLLAAPVAASADTIADITLDHLLNTPGASIIVGDKEIYDFHHYSSVATGPDALPIDPSTIFVKPTILGSELGIKFQSANFYAGSGSTQDTYFDFFVRIIPDARGLLISDNTLVMNGSYKGTGRVTISETVLTADETQSLADKLVIVNQYTNDSVDHKIFMVNDVPTPVPAIHVSKDIGVVGGVNGYGFVSDFSQTFSQTPEPATLSFLVLGGIGALLGRKRR